MDELERDLRSALDRLADGTVASDDLVDRTLARSVQIRRRRRALTVSSLTVALAAMAALASVAGAATRAHVRVTAPPVIEPAATTTTGPPTSIVVTTTTAPPSSSPGTGARSHTPSVAAAPTSTTIPAPCEPRTLTPADNGTFTMLPNGDIEADFYFPFGPARESHYEIFDDGVHVGQGVATNVYTPAQFGPHWLDAWSVTGGIQSCTERLTFDVEPTLTTTTTTVTTLPVSTTIPDTTTIPATTTTAP